MAFKMPFILKFTLILNGAFRNFQQPKIFIHKESSELRLIHSKLSKIARYYDQFSTQQQQTGINHRHLSILRWLEKFGMKREDSVLEIGSGVGTLTTLILRHLSKRGKLTAVDISAESLRLAQQRLAKYSNVEFLPGDIVELPLEQQYEVIVLPDVLEHIPLSDHDGLFKKLYSLLKHDGWILIHIPEAAYLNWCHQHLQQQLQIIDQPLELSYLVGVASNAGFKITHCVSYSIYTISADYQVLRLEKTTKKPDYGSREQTLSDPFLTKLKRRIKYLLRGLK